jgi:tetratricopeptide (TPR) repeat protein
MGRLILALSLVGMLLAAAPTFAKDIPDDVRGLLDQGQYAQAVEPLTAFLQKDKKNHEAWSELGWCYFNLGRYSDAREPFAKAFKLKKKYWHGTHGYAHTLARLGLFEEADEIVRKAIEDSKKDPEVQAMFIHDLAVMQLAEGKKDTANVNTVLLDSADINLYIAIGQAPDSCVYRMDLGDINFWRKSYPIAVSNYQSVLECDASLAGPVYYKMGRAEFYQRNFKGAIDYYQKSLAAEPSGEVASDLGDVWILYSRTLPITDTAGILQAYDQAIASYSQAKKLAADDCRIFEKVGKAEALMGKLEEAVIDFEAAIECGSRDPNVLFALGNVLIDLIRFPEALEWYGRYREYREARLTEEPWNKPDADFFANEGLVLRIMMDSTKEESGKDSLFRRAIASYERALALDPDRADIMDDLGILYYTAKEYEQAIEVFTRKIEMEPDVVNSYLNRAYAYMQLKQYDPMLADLEQMLELDTCNAQALEIGTYVAIFEMERYNLGRKWLDKQLSCDPENCDALMYYGYTYIVTNDSAQIARSIPKLKQAYECRLVTGQKKCSDNAIQNAFWLAQAYMAQRDQDQVVRWCDKVLACEPGHEGCKKLKDQALNEY